MNIVKVILYPILAPLVRMLLRNSIVGKPMNGTDLKLYYDRSQHLGFLFRKKIRYEKEISREVIKLIQAGNLVFELGSNIGQYSLLLAEKIGTTGKLICVEPDSDNFAFLNFNIRMNKIKNAELLHLAISDREGKATFYKDTVTGGRMGSLFQKYTGQQFKGWSEEVQTIPLNQLISRYGIPDFIKVDAEGAENIIFNNSTELHDKTTYLVEVRKETKEYIFTLFQTKGFTVYLLDGKLQRIEKASDIPGFGNLIMKYHSALQAN